MIAVILNNWGKIVVALCVLYIFRLYTIKSQRKISKSSEEQKSVVAESLDDGLLSERRLKPMYNKLSKKVEQSFKWLKVKAKNKMGFPRRRTRGDGLNSIFSDNILADDVPMEAPDYDSDISHVRSDILDLDQQFAFSALFRLGICEGAEISILNELCSNAVLVHYNKGDTIFTNKDSSSKFLYIIKSGMCDVSFNLPDGRNEVVYAMEAGNVVASVVDVISWVIRSTVERHVIVQCTSDCDVVCVPSPRDDNGNFQSRLHTASFARIVRMLLIRFNRTTVTTALFYLGLAEHFLPSFPRVDIPQRLSDICAASSTHPFNEEGAEPALHAECLELVMGTLASLYGIRPEEVELPQARANFASMSGATSVPAERSMQHATTESALRAHRRRSNTDVENDEESDQDTLQTGAVAQGELDDSSLRIPPPITVTRTLSADHLDAPRAGGFVSLGGDLSVGSRPRKLQTGIHLMRKGESILDVDPIPGMYIIITGKVNILFLGTNNLKRVHSGQHRGLSGAVPSTWTKSSRASTLSDGEVIGQISIIAGSSSEWYGRRDGSAPPIMSVIAAEDTWLLRVPRHSYEKALSSRPDVIFHLSGRIIGALPPLIRLFDFCTRWVRLNGGDDIVTRGQAPTGELYVVLNGRMRVLFRKQSPDDQEHSADYTWSYSAEERSPDVGFYGKSNAWIIGRGTLIGDAQLLTGECFRYTVRAIRQTALSKVPMKLLDFLTRKFPSVLVYIVRNVSDKHMAHMSPAPSPSPSLTPSLLDSVDSSNFSKTMMIAPISGSVPVDLVCSTLKKCLERCVRRVLLVTSADAAAVFGGVLDGLAEYELTLTVGSWMHQVELEHDVVLYQGDWHRSAWNKLCVSQCDEILVVANAVDDPEVSVVSWVGVDSTYSVAGEHRRGVFALPVQAYSQDSHHALH